MFRHENGRLVGRAGLPKNTRVGGNEVELAYALAVEYWNRRMATEVPTAILKLAFKRLGLTNIVCFTLPTGCRGARWRRPDSPTSATSPTQYYRPYSTASQPRSRRGGPSATTASAAERLACHSHV